MGQHTSSTRLLWEWCAVAGDLYMYGTAPAKGSAAGALTVHRSWHTDALLIQPRGGIRMMGEGPTCTTRKASPRPIIRTESTDNATPRARPPTLSWVSAETVKTRYM